ncbi:MAG: histone deacetylase [Bacteroidota bacterium]
MRVSYHPGYVVPLPEKHAFPMGKFSALHEILLTEGVIAPRDVMAPREADWSDLLLVHTRRYLEALATSTLSRQEERRMGLPQSPALWRRSRLAVQGTMSACLAALQDGLAGNLAGGTHHSHPDGGRGFCVLNDVGVALRALRRSGWIRRALIVDLDVHQGDGNATLFGGDRAWPHGGAYTFSMHGAKNYPFRKPPSTRDVPLPDAMGDSAYLDTLARHLPEVLTEADPDLVVYLAGVDVLEGDRFGRLALSRDGLAARDRYVCETVRATGVPLCLLLSGGYATRGKRADRRTSAYDTADLHATVFREAVAVYGGVRA